MKFMMLILIMNIFSTSAFSNDRFVIENRGVNNAGAEIERICRVGSGGKICSRNFLKSSTRQSQIDAFNQLLTSGIQLQPISEGFDTLEVKPVSRLLSFDRDRFIAENLEPNSAGVELDRVCIVDRNSDGKENRICSRSFATSSTRQEQIDTFNAYLILGLPIQLPEQGFDIAEIPSKIDDSKLTAVQKRVIELNKQLSLCEKSKLPTRTTRAPVPADRSAR